jgi:hypothetical protein
MTSNQGSDPLREWRWEAYRDHLEDLGYDLDGGTADSGADAAAIPVATDRRAVAVTVTAAPSRRQAGARSGTR